MTFFISLITSTLLAAPVDMHSKEGRKQRAKVSSTIKMIKKFSHLLDFYMTDCGWYPTTKQGLEALLREPQSGPQCRQWGPVHYTKNIAKDPWGHNYIYESDGQSFRIISLGKDSKEGGTGFDADIQLKIGER